MELFNVVSVFFLCAGVVWLIAGLIHAVILRQLRGNNKSKAEDEDCGWD